MKVELGKEASLYRGDLLVRDGLNFLDLTSRHAVCTQWWVGAGDSVLMVDRKGGWWYDVKVLEKVEKDLRVHGIYRVRRGTGAGPADRTICANPG